ncbi:MAG: C25 family cysteine peptidase [Fluviicola sp.]
MKKLFSLFSVFLILFGVKAQNFQLLNSSENGLEFKHSTQSLPFQFTTINGEQYVQFSKTHRLTTNEAGAPELPLYSVNVELPENGNPSISVNYGSNYQEFTNILVAPSKGNLKRNVDPSQVPFSFNAVYTQNSNYPASAAKAFDPFIFRASRGMTIQVAPYQYNPVTKTLRVYSDIQVTVNYNRAENGLNEMEKKGNDPVSQIVATDFFLNHQELKYTVKNEEGEMLIVTTPDLESEITAFANWKNQKGIKTTVVNTTVTGTTAAAIKAYINTFYSSNPNTLYLVLVGDHQQIPAHTYGTAGSEQLWSDSYYGQLTGSDYYPELFVGRFSGQNAAEIRTQVNRTLEYEKNPLAGNWMEKAVGIGSDEGAGYGNLGLADWDHMRQMRTKLMAFGYTTVHEFYDGSHGGADAPGNPSASMLQAAFNEGLGLWNYTGHGWDAGMVTCDYTSTDAINATNYGMYPLVTSVACNNGTFTDGTCVGENFLRANSGGTKGAIGFAGSTILMAWAPPMQTQWEMANIITEQDPANIKRTTGGIFYNGQISMMSEYPGGDGNEVMQTWAYFGDPSTLFRHKQTMPLSFVSPVQVPDATSSLTVTSTTEGARVAISQNNILLGYGFITSGTVTINFPALTTNAPLLVTATKQNHVATQMSVQVGSGALSLSDQTIEVSMYPNPSKETVYFNVNSSESVKFEVISALGQVLSSSTIESNSWTYSVNELPQGVYYARISTSTGVQMLSFQVTK